MKGYMKNKEEVKRQTVFEYLQEMRTKRMALNEKEKVLRTTTATTEPNHEK